jgi:hypothetical protein
MRSYEHVRIDELDCLPGWALLAFAARYTKRILTLYDLPEGTPDRETHGNAVRRAIHHIEHCAFGAVPDQRSSEVLLAQVILASHAARKDNEVRTGTEAEEKAIAAANAADSVVYALRATWAFPDRFLLLREVARSSAAAQAACLALGPEGDEILHAMRHEFDDLWQAVWGGAANVLECGNSLSARLAIG